MILAGLLIPFAGTLLGSAMVFLMKDEMNKQLERILLGFAGGVMIAASVWSLILPSLEMAEESGMGKLSIIPAVVGFMLGVGLLLVIDALVPHLHLNDDHPEGLKSSLQKTTMMMLAVTIHNIPEGMAVGVVLAGVASGSSYMTMAGALALSLGIAIQNFPEGAIISMPLSTSGSHKVKAFLLGTLSGIVEPIGALLMIGLSHYLLPLMPYLLSFAAGAMVYVVVEELIPEANAGDHSNIATIGFAIGFIIMMILDYTLG
ncbi:MAG: ZIP family metal transporter [Erysipelotrichaceae bacterium]|nr:ZIP family metal transporter [Erysipelotrichaceae bacterium]